MTKSPLLAVISCVLIILTPLVSFAGKLDDGVLAFERQNYAMAYEKLLPLAEKGNAKAQYYIGEILVGGLGVSGDMRKGVYWLEQSVNNQYYMAARTLGKMYLSGFGVPMNTEKGASYLLLSQALMPESEAEPECD
jgi:hypothetical protein